MLTPEDRITLHNYLVGERYDLSFGIPTERSYIRSSGDELDDSFEHVYLLQQNDNGRECVEFSVHTPTQMTVDTGEITRDVQGLFGPLPLLENLTVETIDEQVLRVRFRSDSLAEILAVSDYLSDKARELYIITDLCSPSTCIHNLLNVALRT